MTDRVFVTAGDWAVASDGVQWILLRRVWRTRGDSWDAVSFVHSERAILERCAREKGADAGTVDLLTSGLPDTFDQWKALHTATQAPAAAG